jgi:hypothetical protein
VSESGSVDPRTLERLQRVADSFALAGGRRHLMLSASDAAAILAALVTSSKDTTHNAARACTGVGSSTANKHHEVECRSIWRRAIGDATIALGALESRWKSSRRKAEREASDTLAGVLELLWEARDPAPMSYPDAVARGERMIDAVRGHLAAG